MENNRYNKGFTLVELIVTIVVSGIAMAMIGVLLSSILSIYNDSKESDERRVSSNEIFEIYDQFVTVVNSSSEYSNILVSDNTIDATFELNNISIVRYENDYSKVYYLDNGYKIKRIKLIKHELTTNHVLKVKIVFDNDEYMEKIYSFIPVIQKKGGE